MRNSRRFPAVATSHRSAKTVKLKPTHRMMRRQRRDMDGRSVGHHFGFVLLAALAGTGGRGEGEGGGSCGGGECYGISTQ